MTVEFEAKEDDQIVVITLVGDISGAEVAEMRRTTIEVLNETGIHYFLVDMSGVESIVDHDTVAAYEAGKSFSEIKFPYSAKTAIIMPISKKARSQAEFLHTVELNRGRGLIEYVADYQEARRWFLS